MALAETELQPEAKAPLQRDQFVKRRQEQRSAAEAPPKNGPMGAPVSVPAGVPEGGTAGPDDGDGISSSSAKATLDGPEGGPGEEHAERSPDGDPSLFEDDEIASGDEPSGLTGLEPPASMTASEKAAFEGLPDDMKSYVARLHSATARSIQESGQSLAVRTKEIDSRVAELDRSLADAKSVLRFQSEHPRHTQEALARIAQDHGFQAWQKALAENETATAQSRHKLEAIDRQVEARQREILTKFQEELPKLIPSWSKPEVRKKEAGELNSYLLSSGFDESELKMVADARLVVLARKAMRYDAALAKRRERGGKPNGRAQPGPTGARRSAAGGDGKLETAERRYRENPSADNFATLRALKRAQAETNIRRRV